ncbi:hypothetical protein JHK87_015729 [Glycine soja]|nr:hypothetical protein JHK87_015729 [Glycine soja]
MKWVSIFTLLFPSHSPLTTFAEDVTLSTSDVFKFSSFVQNREVVEAREYLVATVDGFGIVVETINVILFLIYAPKGIRGRTLILAVILDVAISVVAVALRLGFDVNLIAIALPAIFGVSFQIIVHIWVMSKKGPLYVAMFKPIGLIFAVIMGIGFLGGSIYLGSVLGAAIAVIGFYAIIWGKSQEQAKEECEVYDDSESYSLLSLFWRTREWRNRIIAII